MIAVLGLSATAKVIGCKSGGELSVAIILRCLINVEVLING